MPLTADRDGVATGLLQIPNNIPTGTVQVEVFGDQGSRGATTYTASSRISTTQRRTVTTVTRYYDPLAQTFSLIEGRHITGVDLWFYNSGASRIQVQIRDTEVGYPNKNVIAQATLRPSDIKTGGLPTRVLFRPIWLEADEEYAIVILTDDGDASLCVAELGQYDSDAKSYITKQPYQTGVLLSSSNASTWTAHQTMDLTFRLLACKFTEKEYTYNLGKVSADGKTEILIRGDVERVTANTDVEFVLTDESGTEHAQTEDMSVALQENLQGEANLKMKLKGTAKQSPVIYQGIQLGLGKLRTEGDYVTRSIAAGVNSKVTVTYDAYIPGNATVKIYYQQADSTWSLIPLKKGSPIGDGIVENCHIIESYNQDTVKIKLVLNGSAQYRPYVKNLRVVTV